jgi:hypothetical protein
MSHRDGSVDLLRTRSKCRRKSFNSSLVSRLRPALDRRSKTFSDSEAYRGKSTRLVVSCYLIQHGTRTACITAQRFYTTYIQTAVRARFPTAIFINDAVGGDNAFGGTTDVIEFLNVE